MNSNRFVIDLDDMHILSDYEQKELDLYRLIHKQAEEWGLELESWMHSLSKL